MVEAEQSNVRSSQEARSVIDTAPLSSSARKTTEGKLASLLHELDLPSHSQIQVEASGHRRADRHDVTKQLTPTSPCPHINTRSTPITNISYTHDAVVERVTAT